MKRLALLAALAAVALAKPELYKEKEDFQFSRSSSDEGSKSGFYGAQRGNMGGNFERSHNMDTLAQRHLSGAIAQVDGELGEEGSKTRTGSVFTSANSAGFYGSGKYDLSNLGGRNFQEGSFADNAQSALTSNAHSSALSSMSRNSHYSNGQYRHSNQNSNYHGGYNVFPSQSQQISAIHGSDGTQGYQNYDYGGQAANAEFHSTSNGQRAFNQYNSNILDKNSDAVINIDTGDQKPKHYQSSYSYHKEWEKHDTKPVLFSVPLNNFPKPNELPVPKNSELYEDLETKSQTSNKYYDASAFNSQNLATNINSGYNAQSKASRNSQLSSEANADAYNQLLGDSSSKPKSYQSSYSYKKSWERQGDPYVIVPAGGSSSVDSGYNLGATQRYVSSANLQDSASYRRDRHQSLNNINSEICDENGYVRVPRSYDEQQFEKLEDLGQQTQNQWGNLEQLGQQTQEQWGNLENLGQQTQNQFDNLEDLGQQTQGHWDKLEDLGQQTQNQWGNLEQIGQQTQEHQSRLEDLGQQTQNQFDKLEDLGQQTQNQWDNLEQIGQQTQEHQSRIEDLGQQTQNQFDKLEDLGQQTQSHWDKLEDLSQQTQQHWGKAEDLSQQTQNQFADLGQQTQSNWDNLGQQIHNDWQNFGREQQHSESNFAAGASSDNRQTQNTFSTTNTAVRDESVLGQSQDSQDIPQINSDKPWDKLNNLNQFPHQFTQNHDRGSDSNYQNFRQTQHLLTTGSLKPNSQDANVNHNFYNTNSNNWNSHRQTENREAYNHMSWYNTQTYHNSDQTGFDSTHSNSNDNLFNLWNKVDKIEKQTGTINKVDGKNLTDLHQSEASVTENSQNQNVNIIVEKEVQSHSTPNVPYLQSTSTMKPKITEKPINSYLHTQTVNSDVGRGDIAPEETVIAITENVGHNHYKPEAIVTSTEKATVNVINKKFDSQKFKESSDANMFISDKQKHDIQQVQTDSFDKFSNMDNQFENQGEAQFNQNTFNQFPDSELQQSQSGDNFQQLQDFGQESANFQQEIKNFEQQNVDSQQAISGDFTQIRNDNKEHPNLSPWRTRENIEQEHKDSSSNLGVIPINNENNHNLQGGQSEQTPHSDVGHLDKEVLQTDTENVTVATSPPETVTESSGFWKSVGGKLTSAKDKVYSWFSSG